jgi:hypothetical protein
MERQTTILQDFHCKFAKGHCGRASDFGGGGSREGDPNEKLAQRTATKSNNK